MRRYIDADKFRALFDNDSKIDGVFYCAVWEGIDKPSDIQFLIDDQPTADVVEVVRCKNCKYTAKGGNESEFWNICTLRPLVYVPVNDEDYCSRGEKKDEGEGAVT